MSVRGVARGLAWFQLVQLVAAVAVLVVGSPADWIEREAPALTVFVPAYTVWIFRFASWGFAQRVVLLAGAFLLIPVGLWLGHSRRAPSRAGVESAVLGVALAVSVAIQAYGLVLVLGWFDGGL